MFVITKTKDLAKYIITVTEKSPKKFRFTLVVRLQNYILDALESLYLANSAALGTGLQTFSSLLGSRLG